MANVAFLAAMISGFEKKKGTARAGTETCPYNIISALKEPLELAREIAVALVDRKAEDVLVMDLTEIAPFIADFFVLATAVTRDHARSLADATEEALAKNERAPHHTEGYSRARWILVDANEVVIHIMTREAREFYAIESLWGDARIERYGDES